MTGFIYAVECGSRIKIGYSKLPDKRFAKIASDAPFPCVLLGFWPAAVADELAVHDKFHAIRVHGEWFASTENLLAFIADHMLPAAQKAGRFDIQDDDSPLCRWRKAQGKTMDSFAEAMDVTKATWCRWELGRVSVPSQKLGKLMSLTGLSFEDLTVPSAKPKKRRSTEREGV
jgi:hypothetical protein